MTTHGTMQIVRGARVLDVAGHTSVPADILIDGDTILEIGAPGMAAPDSAAVIDASDRLLMPGLVNAHTHAHGALAKGMVGDRWPLEVFLNSVGPLTAGKTIEDKYLSGLLTAAEMVLKGCTASYDLFVEFPLPTVEGVHAVAQAYQDVGMRAVIAPMMADRTLYQALPGLIDAIPEPHRRRIARIEAARSRRASLPAAASWMGGASTANESARRWRRPFRCIARMRFSSGAGTWRVNTMSACIPTWRNRGRRRFSDWKSTGSP